MCVRCRSTVLTLSSSSPATSRLLIPDAASRATSCSCGVRRERSTSASRLIGVRPHASSSRTARSSTGARTERGEHGAGGLEPLRRGAPLTRAAQVAAVREVGQRLLVRHAVERKELRLLSVRDHPLRTHARQTRGHRGRRQRLVRGEEGVRLVEPSDRHSASAYSAAHGRWPGCRTPSAKSASTAPSVQDRVRLGRRPSPARSAPPRRAPGTPPAPSPAPDRTRALLAARRRHEHRRPQRQRQRGHVVGLGGEHQRTVGEHRRLVPVPRRELDLRVAARACARSRPASPRTRWPGSPARRRARRRRAASSRRCSRARPPRTPPRCVPPSAGPARASSLPRSPARRAHSTASAGLSSRISGTRAARRRADPRSPPTHARAGSRLRPLARADRDVGQHAVQQRPGSEPSLVSAAPRAPGPSPAYIAASIAPSIRRSRSARVSLNRLAASSSSARAASAGGGMLRNGLQPGGQPASAPGLAATRCAELRPPRRRRSPPTARCSRARRAGLSCW